MTVYITAAAFVLSVVVDFTTALGWIGVGPDADPEPTETTSADDPFTTESAWQDDAEDWGEEDDNGVDWEDEATTEEAVSGWTLEYSEYSMVLENGPDDATGESCLYYLFDFDDTSMNPEAWYETSPDSGFPDYTDLVWDSCGFDYGVEGMSYLYTPNGLVGTLYYAGGDPTPDECYATLSERVDGLSWHFNPWNPSEYDLEETSVFCVQTDDGAIAMSTIDSIHPEDERNWMRIYLTTDLYVWS
ncbi:hypothetical protein [Glycomyces arizonensis]|uniref:hypothetical protein n=1 Tax=Glycomyces arizonensis TaxID=256035 RepID=UPI00047D2DD6|nr:hypothetical protein [Glycomyces arizonensis]